MYEPYAMKIYLSNESNRREHLRSLNYITRQINADTMTYLGNRLVINLRKIFDLLYFRDVSDNYLKCFSASAIYVGVRLEQ